MGAADLFSGAGTSGPQRPTHQRMESLPQHGFGPALDAPLSFRALVAENPFLFRVYTPKRGRRAHASDPFFVGPKFTADDDTPFSDAETVDSDGETDTSATGCARATYVDAVRHLDWTTRARSPCVSTSFSFAWALWEAARRYRAGVKHDVHVAVIDARALLGRATTALELLRQGRPSERHRDHAKFVRFATEAQDVLVFGCVPAAAVLSSVPLVELLYSLPVYFADDLLPAPRTADRPLGPLTPPPSPRRSQTSFRAAAPARPSYTHFCTTLSERFLRGDADARLADTSAHAVRLAAALLRPWLHAHIDDDTAGETLGALARVIAQWPAQWWTRANDVGPLVQSIAQVVADEIRDARRAHALAEVERMQAVVTRLQHEHAVAAPPPPYASRWTTGPPPPPEEVPYRLPPLASALVSGLLFGSFCMLSIISSQRWELANHLT